MGFRVLGARVNGVRNVVSGACLSWSLGAWEFEDTRFRGCGEDFQVIGGRTKHVGSDRMKGLSQA